MSIQQNPFIFKDGKIEIQSGNEKPHHIRLVWFYLIMKWLFKFTCAYWGILYGLPKVISYLAKI